MALVKHLSSKKFFIFNLVLLGALFGFSLAFLSFSCSRLLPGQADKGQATGVRTAQAQEAAPVPKNSLEVAQNLQTAFKAVADKVQPSVVELKTTSTRRQQIPNGIPWEFFFGPQDEGPGRREREYRSQGLGSGIIVQTDAKTNTYYVLTNAHVVKDADEIEIDAQGERTYPAKLVGQDERKDLAMVSFTTQDKHPVAELGDSDDVKTGDWAIAVGNPLGFMSSVTMGIISAVGRTNGPGGNINDFLQTDASINQGNSGGALVNIRGEVIGINTWIASNNGGGSVGLGFAIPINNAKRTIGEFINKGEITYGWLGVSLAEADNDIKSALGVSGKQGALASMVFGGSPADKGGILPGDFITKLDGKDVRGVQQLQLAVGDLIAGTQHNFTVLRGGSSVELKVKIEERTNDVASNNAKLWPGVMILPLTDKIREELKISKTASGVIALQPVDKSPAAVMGLQRNDIITALNGEPVKDMAGFYKALREKAGKELWFDVLRGDSKLEMPHYKR
ncbi:MAG: Do family serine endopeptidase [Spirochaetaceae bacterium]|jgi:Do/DeqQ family serine protease|nr:Do family serine endopeptidase [Spirochaetaceae bacterium]